MIQYKQLMITIGISFFIALILGPIVIPILQKLKAGQSIRHEGPKTHYSKAGTPTIGGIIIIAAVFITTISSGRLNTDLYIVMFATLAFGFIGFIDDFIKVVLKRNLGLKAYQKLIGQVLIAIGIAVYQAKISSYGTQILIPFFNKHYLDLGILYIPYIVFVVVATTNSVNLTDGLDGLAAGVTLIVSSFFSLVALNWGYPSIAVFCGALTGACLGFLKFNAHPAKVFMGDTGSMALGGAIASVAILMNLTLFIPIVGGIYFAEALSVIIQVISFKLTGKRVFKMSPLHHHFELCGWKETKVVIVFWSVTLILCIIGLYALK
ncbi:Phospho-N-acetylmuramoyl-pentapeptide-transferase [Caminicella sporogenes DSM 14501]|uniref:Phospho-N-acetylmuramoyl-pentapeptide-transferase n=1 Tax=Caminicella sporogenes DSM 14501 TaxID=1121266 RepID=A0A1M6L0X1_9FIRM|nr:phospho-N-acetylmuramoyl-pentapeptide-transferase [Caminicella sporogenes]RKD27669.1 phospho-N-acetylmuramoyl-pentapeptide-transferase [Caminicella sporogenes]WIF94754.1 phospho-N-acetylmuramoyl-pentapeptide-transferase [Caminicella sporogenes]SHJ64925.1 Phospho-N-acetylmuramoyl-pentapeptide-transferase [Caminicella sporogenes DSM 14501]